MTGVNDVPKAVEPRKSDFQHLKILDSSVKVATGLPTCENIPLKAAWYPGL